MNSASRSILRGLFGIGIWVTLTFAHSYELSAKSVYASTTGNDSSAGTQAAPYRTIQKGIASISAGDTLFLCAAACDGSGSASFSEGISGMANGTNWTTGAVTIMAYPGEAITLIGPNAGLGFSGNAYVIIDGISVDHTGYSTANGAYITNSNHIRIQNGSFTDGGAGNGIILMSNNLGCFSYIEILNNHIHHANVSRTDLGSASHGIYMSAGHTAAAFTCVGVDLHVLIKGNEIDHNNDRTYSYGIQTYGGAETNQVNGVTIQANRIHHNSNGIVIGWAQVAGLQRVFNNLIYSNDSRGVDVNIATGVLIYNNTFYGQLTAIDIGALGWARGVLIKNNSISGGNTPVQIWSTDSSSYVIAQSNNFYGGKSEDLNQLSTISGNISADPLLANPTSTPGDFHQGSSTALVDAGVNLSATLTDAFDGAPRPSGAGFDIGAYETGGVPPPTTPPPTTPPAITYNRSQVAADAFTAVATACVSTYSANWTLINDAGTTNCLKVDATNGVVYGATDSYAGWVARQNATYANDQYASLKITAMPADSSEGLQFVGVGVRIGAATGATRSLYEAVIYMSGTTQYTSLVKVVSGVETNRGTTTSVAWSVGNRVELEAFGSAIRIMKDGVVVQSYDDASPIATGKAGMVMAGGANARAAGDDFIGGNLYTGTLTNAAPVSNAGPDQTITLPAKATVSAGATTDDGLPSGTLSYVWSVVSGTGVTFASPNSMSTLVTFASAGARTLKVTVSDGALTSSDNIVITVNPAAANVAPISNAGPDQTITLPAAATVTAAASTDDGQPAGNALTYVWSVVSGTGATLASPNSSSTPVSFTTAGVVTLKVTVSDGALSSSDNVAITVNPAPPTNQAPVSSAGPDQTITLPGTATLTAAASTDDGLPSGSTLTYLWSVVSGTGVTLTNPTSSSALASFAAPGSYTLRVTVSDGLLSSSDDVVLTAAQAVYTRSQVAADAFTANGTGCLGNYSPAWVLISDGGLVNCVEVDATSDVIFGSTNSYEGWVARNSATFSNNQYASLKIAAMPADNSEGLQFVGVGARIGAVLGANRSLYEAVVYMAGATQYTSLVKVATGVMTGLATDTSIVWAVGNRIELETSGSMVRVLKDGLVVLSYVDSSPLSGGAPGIVMAGGSASVAAGDDFIGGNLLTGLLTNRAPVVNAGSAQTITLPATATVTATASDDALPNSTLTYQWSVVSGSGVTFASPNSAVTQVSFSTAGVRVLRVTVNDGLLSAFSDVTISVNAINLPPVSNAGPDQTITLPATAALSAAASTDDGLPNGVLTYLWSVVSGTGVTFTSPNSAVTQASFASPGARTLRVTVGDGALSSSANVTITVNSANLAPVSNAGPDQTITLPATAALTAAASTDDGLPAGSTLTYLWSVVSGTGVTFTNPGSSVTQASFSSAGARTLKVTVSDGTLSSSANVTITVNAPVNQAPISNAGPDQTITLPATAALTAAASTDDGLPAGSTLTYLWSVVSGTGVTFTNPGSSVTQASFSSAGARTLKVTVSDGTLSSSANVTITVNAPVNQAPISNAGPDQTITLPATAALTAAASTDDGLPAGSTLTYLWSVVSGTGVTFTNPGSSVTQASFSSAGARTLKVTVSDGTLSSSANVTITVNAPVNQAPISNAGPDQTITLPAAATLTAAASTDDGLPAGSTLTYLWSIVSGTGVTLTSPGSSTTQASFTAAGSYTLRVTVSDGLLSSSDDIVLTATNAVYTRSQVVTDAFAATATSCLDAYSATWVLTSDGGTVNCVKVDAATAMIYGSTDSYDGWVVRNTANFAGDQYASLKIAAMPADNSAGLQFVGVAARIGTAIGAARTLYEVVVYKDGTLQYTSLVKVVNGVASLLASTTSVTWSAGNRIEIEASGSMIKAFKDGVAIQSYLDPNPIAGGKPGIVMAGGAANRAAGDDFIGGNLFSGVMTNLAPVSNAGPDQTITLPATAAVTASATDDGLPNGSTLTYKWTVVTGTGVTFANPNAPGSQVSFASAGARTLRVTVTDGALSSTDDVVITVIAAPPVNAAPVSNAGPDQTISWSSPATLNAAATRDDGLPAGSTLTYQWSVVTGNGVTLTKPNAQSAQASFSAAGSYTLRVTASDGALSSSDDVVIVAKDPVYTRSQLTTDAFTASTTACVDKYSSANWVLINDATATNCVKVDASKDVIYGTTNSYDGWVARHNAAFTADQYASLKIVAMPADNSEGLQFIGVGARIGTAIGANRSLYEVVVSKAGTVQYTSLVKVVAGIASTLDSTTTVTWAVGNRIEIEAYGSMIRALKDGVVVHTYMDLNPIAGGKTGVVLAGGTATRSAGDDFIGGNLIAGATSGLTAADTTSSDKAATTTPAVPPAGPPAGAPAGNIPPPANLAPVSNAGPDQTITLPATATLTATATTSNALPAGRALTYQWSVVSGTGVTFASAGSARTQVSFSSVGVRVLRVTVSDGQLSSSDDVEVSAQDDSSLILIVSRSGETLRGQITPINVQSDDSRTLKMELLVDGKIVATVAGGSLFYRWNARNSPGSHEIKAIAYGATGILTSKSVAILVQ